MQGLSKASSFVCRIGLSLAALGTVFQPAEAAEQGPKPAVHASKAMASSSATRSSRKAMLDVLKKGGNAMDAVLTGVIRCRR
jgi:gamma-glutamyltranspeptidase/glutathione hydrolase